ncbi:hypothetical protein EUZ85_26740 [Hahella sp. KA22]|uniref:hypothetical protein n=1 Tax=Hahella sp. KA22 TaxID=1628392 RepID=UPI000FDD04A1|nr:hypothetical protein [Hahella sp. KA22]AZZ94121.1 hypothetical protein ENC22_24155 [Hahella sp. KA22]QAY57495.1 hypothetical protein EUZ85_26740 [Hahella sp. KA22]
MSTSRFLSIAHVLKSVLASLLLTLGILVFCGMQAQAAVITVLPSSSTVLPGQLFTVDISISGLAPGGAPSLSTFDLNLNFDPGAVAIDATDADGNGVMDSVSLDPGGQLDVLGLGLNPMSAELLAPGELNLFDLSLDIPADLDAHQDNSFLLASLSFTALSSGFSYFSVVVNALGNSLGNPIAATVNNGDVTVVAEPGLLQSLFIGGLMWIGMAGLRKRGAQVV